MTTTNIIIFALSAMLTLAVIYIIYLLKRRRIINVITQAVDSKGVFAYLEEVANNEERSAINVVEQYEQPEFAELTPMQQVMKSEENSLRCRLRETIKFRKSSAFSKWKEDRQLRLTLQLGAMIMYHNILVARCLKDGVLIDNSPKSTSSDE